jgi:hypothetical protein
MEGSGWNQAEIDALRSTYMGFQSVYWRCVNRVTGKLLQLKKAEYQRQFEKRMRDAKSELVALACEMAKPGLRSTAMAQMLLAVIFAWWTVSDCKPALDTMRSAADKAARSATGGGGGGVPESPGGDLDAADTKKYLRQPHAAQVLSVFRLLGIHNKCRENYVDETKVGNDEGAMAEMFELTEVDHSTKVQLENHMAEIKTGEGASTRVPARTRGSISSCLRARVPASPDGSVSRRLPLRDRLTVELAQARPGSRRRCHCWCRRCC